MHKGNVGFDSAVICAKKVTSIINREVENYLKFQLEPCISDHYEFPNLMKLFAVDKAGSTITTYHQYHYERLYNEIEKKRSQNQFFSEEELWFLMY